MGWDEWSVGIHGDYGRLYEESDQHQKEDTMRWFGPKHTVGCGIDYARGVYFFTLDGDIISKTAPSSPQQADVHRRRD